MLTSRRFGGQAGDVLAAELDGARGRLLEAGDHPQHGRLARPGRAEHREELAGADLKVGAGDGDDRRGPGELLAQAPQADRGCRGAHDDVSPRWVAPGDACGPALAEETYGTIGLLRKHSGRFRCETVSSRSRRGSSRAVWPERRFIGERRGRPERCLDPARTVRRRLRAAGCRTARGCRRASPRRLHHVRLLPDGSPLPAESDLADRLGVATTTVREALSTLRAEGLIRTRRGRRGGSFVCAPADGGRAALLERLRRTGSASGVTLRTTTPP